MNLIVLQIVFHVYHLMILYANSNPFPFLFLVFLLIALFLKMDTHTTLMSCGFSYGLQIRISLRKEPTD